MTSTLTCLVFCGISVLLTKFFCFIAEGTSLMDNPNHRSLHTQPTLRGGGLIFIGIFLSYYGFQALFYSVPPHFFLFLGLVLVLAIVNFCDDCFNLPVMPRLLSQSLVGVITALGLQLPSIDLVFFSLNNPILILVFLFLLVAWAINHFNFMDGLDGLCGLQACFLCLAYAFLFHWAGGGFYEELCRILMSTVLGFLMFNLPPARLFMGDIGSACLGFISIMLALIAYKDYQIPLVYWAILNGVFLFDATITLLRRLLHREALHQPHKKQAYQRLKGYGVGGYTILIGQGIINALLFLIIYLSMMQWFSLAYATVIALLLLSAVYCGIERLCPMYTKPSTMGSMSV